MEEAKVIGERILKEAEFDGDIIITDPCYITKNGDWTRCGYGEDMEVLGLQTYLINETMYGDWFCTVFDIESHAVLGNFCADAGMVAVFDLAEVLQYNPEFDYHINRKWTTTLIPDFKGNVKIIERYVAWEEDGNVCNDSVIEVEGHGINRTSGEPIDFVGYQTGY